jgi:hypothetical protein
MTDGDIERCKKFRHFSIGSIVFYLVMVAAYIAMFSEALIEQLMDVSISSVWLGFLLINNKIYTVSPLLIVVIYGSILGFTGYRLWIFIPSVKRARAARASKLGSAQDFKRLKPANQRPRKGITRSCRALSSKIMDNFGQLMDLLSNSAKISRALRERRNNETWTSMNRTQSDATSGPMGSVPRSPAPKRFSNLVHSTAQNNNRKPLLNRRSTFRLSAIVVSPEVNIPPLILAMRGTGVTFVASSESYVADQITAKAFFRCADDSAPSCLQDLPIVYAASALRIGMRAKSYRVSKGVTSDPHEALRRLLSRHFLGSAAAERGDEISTLEEKEALNCTFYLSELKSHLNFILDIYYPNDSILSQDERVEIFENFHSWWQSARLQTVPRRGHVPTELSHQMDRVRFSAFSSWFLLVSEKLVVAHTTRSGPVTI